MGSIGILTDGTASYPGVSLAGLEGVHVLKLPVRLTKGSRPAAEINDLAQLPPTLGERVHLEIGYPSPQTISTLFSEMTRQYEQVFGIFHASGLSPVFENAAAGHHGLEHERVYLIDTQTISVGLGYIIQLSAQWIAQGERVDDIRRRVLGTLPKVYTMFHIQGLSYLAKSGFMDPDQAAVGEIMDFKPIFLLEKGRLVPTRKVRSSRQLVDCFSEFVGEFGKIDQVQVVYGSSVFEHEIHLLRERLVGEFRGLNYLESWLDPVTASIFGPQTLGIFVFEKAG